MADRFGPRFTLTRIVLWWPVFTALTGAVSSYPLLLLTRLWFGAGCMVPGEGTRARLRRSLHGYADRRCS
jgi:hypothetical protein